MLPHEIPDRPWSKLGTDLFELHKENYYHSNFFEVMKLTSTKTPTKIKHCKTTFARHGIPDVLISDNGRRTTTLVHQLNNFLVVEPKPCC